MNVFSELSLNEMESWPCPYTSALPSQALHVSLERTNLHICALGAPPGQSGTVKAKEYSVNLLRAPCRKIIAAMHRITRPIDSAKTHSYMYRFISSDQRLEFIQPA